MTNSTSEANIDAVQVLEQGTRLSQSLIWQFQRTYFEKQGMNAWRQGAVPHYITSNPYIADAYARVVLANIRDWQTLAGNGSLAFDPHQPIYIVELGTGTGRFAFHFLKQLERLIDQSNRPEITFQYVMTDFVQANIDFWREHPTLRPFVTQGKLDFAHFDAEHPQPLELIETRTRLSAETISNPLIVIANYFFDAIPQDVYYLQGGQLHEGRVTITSPQAEPDFSDPAILSRIQVGYEHRPVTAEVYDDPDFNQLLTQYSQRLGETTILFPYTAMTCIRFFRQLANEQMLLISGDKGFHWEEDLVGWGEPEMVIHDGCFSMALNFHALGKYIENLGGRVFQTAHHHPNLDIAAFLFGPPAATFQKTSHAFEQAIEKFSPDDLFKLLNSLNGHYDALTLDQMLAWLKLSRWDANLLMSFFPALMNQLPTITYSLREELIWVIDHIWDNYFNIGDGQNLAFYLGTILCGLGAYPQALVHLEHSLAHAGPDPRTYYNISLCLDALQQQELALERAQEALTIDPEFEPAKALIVTIESKLSRKARRSGYSW